MSIIFQSIIVIIEILINTPLGILYSSSTQIKTDYNLTDYQYGKFYSHISYFLFIGYIFGLFLINKNTKLAFIVSLFLKGISLICYNIIGTNYYSFYFMTALSCISYMIPSILIPLLLDKVSHNLFKETNMEFYNLFW